MKRKTRKYWYLFTIIECPVCGSGTTYKERQYSKKPKDGSKRYHYYYESGCYACFGG